MTDLVRNAIEKIRAVSPQLNKATDEANQVMKIVEVFLNEQCSIGLPASVTVSTSEEMRRDQHTTCYKAIKLKYDRGARGKFRILVEESTRRCELGSDGYVETDKLDAVTDQRPWAETSRDVKLATFSSLPQLLEAIADKAVAAVNQTHDTSAAVTDILAAMASVGPKTQDDQPHAAPVTKTLEKIADYQAKAEAVAKSIKHPQPKTDAVDKIAADRQTKIDAIRKEAADRQAKADAVRKAATDRQGLAKMMADRVNQKTDTAKPDTAQQE